MPEMRRRILLFIVVVAVAAGAVAMGGLVLRGGRSAARPGPPYAVRGVAIDANGNIYTTDRTHQRVVELSSSGNTLAGWRYEPIGGKRLPLDMAIDSHGNLYVLDGAGGGTILRRAAHSTRFTRWGPRRAWTDARHLAVDRHGNVYVADSGKGRIVEISSHGRLLRSINPAPGHAPVGGFGGLAVGVRGGVYATVSEEDKAPDRLVRLLPNGHLRDQWSSNGAGSHPLSNPAGVALDELGFIYVADGSGHVNKYTSAGDPIGRWKAAADASAVAVDESENVYVADNRRSEIVKLAPNGSVVATWR